MPEEQLNSNMTFKEDITMSDLSNTQFFQVEPGPQISAKDILEIVFKALKEKGIQSGQSDRGIHYVGRSDLYYQLQRRKKSCDESRERDELVEELLKAYIEHNSWE